MAKSDELVKFLTQQVVRYIETPKEVRKQVRAGRREARERWQYRWFGMLPLALQMWFDSAASRWRRWRRGGREGHADSGDR